MQFTKINRNDELPKVVDLVNRNFSALSQNQAFLQNHIGTHSASTPVGVSGHGTVGYLPKFIAPNRLGDSNVYQTNQFIGINTSSPACALDVSGSRFRVQSDTAPTAGAGLELGYDSGSNQGKVIAFDQSGAAYKTLSYIADQHIFNVSGTNVLSIDGSHIVNHQSPNSSGFITERNVDANSENYFQFRKSRGNSTTKTVVQNNDWLGTINFIGYDGASYRSGAMIQARVSNTPGASDMPTSLIFSTTSDGAASATERMRINEAGKVGIGKDPERELDIEGSSTSGIQAQIKNTNVSGFSEFQAINSSDLVIAMRMFGISYSGTFLGQDRAGAAEIKVAASAERLMIGTSGAKNFYLGTNETTALTIDGSSQNVTAEERIIAKRSGGGNSAALRSESTAPFLALYETGVTADNGWWDIGADSEKLLFRTVNDASNAARAFLTVERTGVNIDSIVVATGAGSTALTIDGSSQNVTAEESIISKRSGGGSSAAIRGESGAPFFALYETDAAIDNRWWDIGADSEKLSFRTVNDASNAARAFLTVERTGTSIDDIVLATGPGTTALTIDDSQDATFTGNVDALSLSTGNETFTYDEGSYTGTVSGGSTSPTTTIHYVRVGNLVVLNMMTPPSNVTSNANTFQITGAPASIRPLTRSGFAVLRAYDNSAVVTAQVAMTTSGDLQFCIDADAAGWTSSGSKGFDIGGNLIKGFTFSYTLD